MSEVRCNGCGRWVNNQEENIYCKIEGIKRKEYCEECWSKLKLNKEK